jgi:DNA polymerase-3 subunit delta
MPIYLYWGTDDFAIAQAIKTLREQVLDPAWVSFNYNKISPEQSDAITQGLNQAMTPPFGAGSRLTWLADTTLCQRCPDDLLSEIERTFSSLPDASILLLTSQTKPDSRLKVTKLVQKYAEIREFSPLPPWKGDLILKQVKQVAQEMGVKLTAEAADLLTESVGNNTRQLYSALEKLRLYAGDSRKVLDEATVATLVAATQQNTLKLAAAVRQGQVAPALEMVAELLQQNEPALRIVSTLIGEFRRWLWIKLMIEAGEREDSAIAKAAEIPNPKRLYFLRQEVQSISSQALLQTLPLLLELEFSLKDGADDLAALQTKIVELCCLFGDR